LEAEFKKLWGEKVMTLVQKVVLDQLTSNMDPPGVGRFLDVKCIVLHQEEREMGNKVL
jgi:hypothetical protein